MNLMKIEGALWYEFDQNNSGGYFERDNFVADVVFIQAMSADNAEDVIKNTNSRSSHQMCVENAIRQALQLVIDRMDIQLAPVQLDLGKS